MQRSTVQLVRVLLRAQASVTVTFFTSEEGIILEVHSIPSTRSLGDFFYDLFLTCIFGFAADLIQLVLIVQRLLKM